jgi:AcrR family transcriptional regulator
MTGKPASKVGTSTHVRALVPPALVPKPRSRVPDARERLIGFAAKLFRDKGYTGTSIRDIATRAKVEPSALYYHFSSKEALLEEVLDRSIAVLMRDVRGAIAALPPEADPRERIQAAIAAHLSSHLGHGAFGLASRRVVGQIPVALRRRHEAARAEYGELWQGLFSDAAQAQALRPGVQIGPARMFLLGALNWTSEWFDAGRKSPDELAAIFCNLLFDGLGTLDSKGKKSG